MKRLLLLLVSLTILLPGIAQADLANMLVNSSTGLTDLSFMYLQDIFGVVDGVLHGSGTQIMGQMFGAFNSAVLTLGFVILTYIFFVSTINTAHEGEVMGKRWSSIWIPLRVVASTALIVPKASGYCAIQIFVMGVVLSGVLAADKVMGAALVYMENGGVLIQSSPPPDTSTVTMAGNILKSLTCMNGIYNIIANDATVNNRQLPSKFVPTSATLTTLSIANIPSTSEIDFPSADATYPYNNTNYKGFCGDVTWAVQSETSYFSSQNNQPTQQDIRGVAVQQVIFDLQPYAQDLANAIVPPKSSGTLQPISTQKVSDVVTANNLSLVFAAADYKGIMLPYFSQQQALLAQDSQQIIVNTAKQGWLMLGSLYFNIAQLNNNSTGSDNNAPQATFTVRNDPKDTGYQFLSSKYGADLNNLNCASGCSANVLTNLSANSVSTGSTNLIDANIANSATNTTANGAYNANTTSATASQAAGGGGSQIIQIVLGPFLGPIYGIIYNMQALMNAENENTDPIIAISGIGASLVSLVSEIWFGVGVTIFSFALGMAAVPCVNLSNSINTFLAWFVPMFSALLIALFVSGAVMAFYIPLIPFILFTFTAIGWFAAVLESMIAAPLVALGIAVPEGHEIYGRAEPAINLLSNIFLRPTLMVFGFFGGAILSHVGLWLLNKGYGVAWGWAITSNAGGLGIFGILWGLVAGLVIYMSLVMAIINQTFGLIHQLPDEITRWIGGGVKSLGTSPVEALSTAKGDFKGAAEMGAGQLSALAKESRENKASEDNEDGGVGIKGSNSPEGKKGAEQAAETGGV